MKKDAGIESIGVMIPKKIVTTSSIVERMNLSQPLKLELMSGISERRVCSETEDSLTLATGAALDCLERSGIAPSEVDMIIYSAISRYVDGLKHVYEPAISLMIRDRLGMESAMYFDISNACAGMLTGMHIGLDFIERGMASNCMIVSGEYITSLSENAIENIRSPLSPEIASLTLGDAGAAVMLSHTGSRGDRIVASSFTTLGDYCNLCMGYQNPKKEGGVMRTEMKKIHDASIRHAPSVIEEALSEAGLTLDQIDHIIPHQTSKQAIRAGHEHFSSHFGNITSNVAVNLKYFGNTASTSHVVALDSLLREGVLQRGEKVMMLCFASGLVIGVMIFAVGTLIEQYGGSH
jgi:3-oxoacyl-[acyl-carrier-protein] synthase-3